VATALEDLRRYIDEPTQAVYSDIDLSTRIDTAVSLNHLAREIWLEKAARYSRLVDMQEGSSRRTLSQLYTQALGMAGNFGKLADDGAPLTSRPTRIRSIERA
jgi:hypothetical protein